MDTGEPCGLRNCKKTVARLDIRINWIQCDNCNTWCHNVCANISNTQVINKETPFICQLCKGNTFDGFTSQETTANKITFKKFGRLASKETEVVDG